MGFSPERAPILPPTDDLELEIIPPKELPVDVKPQEPIRHVNEFIATKRPAISDKVIFMQLPDTREGGIKISSDLKLLKAAMQKYLRIEHEFTKKSAPERDTLRPMIIANLNDIISDIPTGTPAQEFIAYRNFFEEMRDKLQA